MIAELGHFATILALMLALLGATVPHFGIARGDARMMAVADNAAIGQFLMALIAFGALMYSYIISDFSVYAVAANSHTAKPMLYKIAGVWGNHEGSLLLWILMLTLFAAALSVKGRKLPQRFRTRVIAVQSALVVGFLLFIIFTSNPFVRLDPAPFEGNGLNPLLQDAGLAFHPPMLYLGYVGLSVAFSFAVAALIEGEVTPLWARWVRPWTLVAWMFLTAGIILGSWWAYYELGWGGWWFWDPAENASFMPWLVATALLHSAIVVEKRDALKSWTILLSIVAFSFSLLGTFLVRSGVITSVHAFANDPARGIFILGFLVVVIGGALTLYAWRAPKLTPGGLFGMVSRESALVLNNVLLSTFAGVVLVGTLYPLVLEAMGAGQISVGAPFFDFGAAVLMSPLIVALGFGPLLAWKRGRLPRAATTLLPALIVALVVGVYFFWSSVGGAVMTAFGLTLATWLLASVLMEIAERTQLFKKPAGFLRRLSNLPRASWGMSLAHAGVAVLLFGITISEAWTEEKLVIMQRGDTAEVGDYMVRFDGVTPVVGPNYTAIQGMFHASHKSGGEGIALEPQDRLYSDPVMDTTEAAIHSMPSADLYAVIGEAAGGGRWSVRLYHKPFVFGLWLGAAMMVLGGFLSLTDRRLRVGAPKAKKIKAEA